MNIKRRKEDQGKKSAVISLTLIAFFLGALMVNDSLVRSQNPRYLVTDNTSSSDIQKLNRAIANAQPMNLLRDIEWEKKMAERLSQDKIEDRTPASVGKPGGTLEQLRCGDPLRCNYHLIDANVEKGIKIREIVYVDSEEVANRPSYVDPGKFLKDYGSLLAVEFSYFRPIESTQSRTLEYQLLNESEFPVGRASFQIDEDGRMLSLKVLPLEP